MTYRHSTADFAGITVDAFLDEANNSYVTITSLGAGLGVSRQNTNQWLKRHNKEVTGIPVKVGTRQVPATAYPVSVVREFMNYRRSLGDLQAIALTDAIVEAALDRHAKESNLVTVTSAQNEAVMVAVRLGLVAQWAADYETDKASFRKEATAIEKDLVYAKVTIARHEATIERMYTDGNGNPAAMQVIKDAEQSIERTKSNLQAQGVSC